MIQDYVFIAVFASFPETLLMLLIGFNLSNIREINISKFLIVAFIQAIVALFVRMSNIYFGVDTIIQIISLYILVIVFFKIKYYKAIIPVLLGTLSQGLMQSTILPIINFIWDIEFANIYNNTQNLMLFYIPIFIVSLILLIVIRKNRISLCDINS